MNIKIIIILIMIIIIVVMMIEDDRLFNNKNNNYYYPAQLYYINLFPLPILGFYNTIIRAFHPQHTHSFKIDNFESLKILENNYDIIKNEALSVYNKKNLINMRDIADKAFDTIDNQPNLWKIYLIKWYDKISKNAYIHCPQICRIIEQLKDVQVAMISILEPGKVIIPHKGPSTGFLRYHLGLKIPKDKENCFIVVNNEKFYWEEGQGLLFDDTYVHSVYNNTNEPRIILFVDIARPVVFPFNHINSVLTSFSKFTNFVQNVNKVAENTSNIHNEYFQVQ